MDSCFIFPLTANLARIDGFLTDALTGRKIGRLLELAYCILLRLVRYVLLPVLRIDTL